METAQLSYFLLACQFRNHAEAASFSNLSPSTLSENIDALERELGVILFERGPLGHIPTEAARWLYQYVEPLLQAVEAAETLLRTASIEPVRRLEINSPLQFMAGRLSRATSLAIRALRERIPNAVATARFALSRPPYVNAFEESPLSALLPTSLVSGTSPVSRIELDYAEELEDSRSVLLLRDPWIAIGSGHKRGANSREIVSFETLREAPLFLPPLAEMQLDQARAYCLKHALQVPVVIDGDVGTFAWLSRESGAFHLLAPESLVATSLSRLNLPSSRLPVEMVSFIVARQPSTDDIGLEFIRQLQSSLQITNPIVRYRPQVTIKQIRYFLAAREHLNVTAAAKHLRIAQPALSSQLQKLEAIVGQQVFERRHDGLRQNLSTELLVELFRPQMTRFDEIAPIAAHYAASQRERLTIGLMPTSDHNGALACAIANTLSEWMESYPSIKLKILEGPTEVLRRLVETGEVGFALVEAQVSRSWQVDLDTEDRLGVVSNPTRGLLPPGEISLRDAAKLPLALPGKAFGFRQILDRAATDAGVHLTPDMEVNSLTIALALVGRMRLATILPESSVERFVENGEFQFNPIAEPAATRRLSILFSPDRNLTDVERALIRLLRQHLSRSGIGKIKPFPV